MANKKVNVALLGLGFGAEFIPIYQKHPNANMYAICQRTESKLKEIGDEFGIDTRYTSYEEMLKDPEVDAVHINTPIQMHAEHTLMALRAGKHVACTVPMATTIEDCEEIVKTVKETGLKYTMAETVVYSREFLFVKELYEKGELGDIQYLQASHPQDMEGWPEYWERMKPMHYATHVVSPVLGLMNKSAEYVSCFGSGKISDDLIEKSGCPFAVQSAHIKLLDSDVSAHIYRSLFDTARQYRESFDAYGSKKSFEWALIEGEEPVIHTAKKPEPEIPERVKVPDYGHRLPKEIQSFTQEGVYDAEDQAHLSFIQGAGHGGSHPHLAHEFVSSIVEDRDPYPNAVQSANWTCVGLLAHESSMNGGEIKKLPEFTLSK
ncbi:gfo/Idh/MocA family oxidoreductase [Rhodohalobacter sp. SW132]|uniref:Gfo/Idh/MocA family protein n=1 Tax=Rhodohalobacter sp. SW132 TaxID=2293433 RepID=UPI000E224C17|nr:Gfo/Idh/MocA family oxidoreductase [Rhodohalobacter sp. SW132]REL37588.1 gfo/Idh/MocA family oxidoreductase [Rhodohalobacter sp. SW132]